MLLPPFLYGEIKTCRSTGPSKKDGNCRARIKTNSCIGPQNGEAIITRVETALEDATVH
jgi:hypothetical protein